MPVVGAVGVVAVIALVGGLFAVRRDGDQASPSPGEPPSGSSESFDAVVADITAFVERERGLEFEAPVEVELADDEEFAGRLLEDFEESRDDIAESQLALQATGLIEPGTDLFEVLEETLSAGVVGFYDPETDELVVRGTDTTPYVRVTMAHELVHALDDQHFELDRPEIEESDGEDGFGFDAVVEGNAVRIEESYLAALSDAERDAYFDEETEIGRNFPVFSIPQVVIEMLVAPYTLGPVLVERVLDAGGQEALDAAFEDPPVTSEQVLEPETFIEGEGPRPVAAPAADGAVASEGAFGAFPLQLLLGQELADAEVEEAVSGWGGDAYVAWQDGRRTCIRASFVGDTEADTEELTDALEEWAVEDGEAEVSGGSDGDPVTFTRCA